MLSKHHAIVSILLLVFITQVYSGSLILAQQQIQIPIISPDNQTPQYTAEILDSVQFDQIREIAYVKEQDLYFVAAGKEGVKIVSITSSGDNSTINLLEPTIDTFDVSGVEFVYSVSVYPTFSSQDKKSGVMFVSAGSQGLIAFQYDIDSRFTTIEEIWRYTDLESITLYSLVGKGDFSDRLFVVEGPNGIVSLDISNVSDPGVVSSLPGAAIEGRISFFAFQKDNSLFVASGTGGVDQFEIKPTGEIGNRLLHYEAQGIAFYTLRLAFVPNTNFFVTAEGEFGSLVYEEQILTGLPGQVVSKPDIGYSTDGFSRNIQILRSSGTQADFALVKTQGGWDEIRILADDTGNLTIEPIRQVSGIEASALYLINEDEDTYLIGSWDGLLATVRPIPVKEQGRGTFVEVSSWVWVASLLVLAPILNKRRR